MSCNVRYGYEGLVSYCNARCGYESLLSVVVMRAVVTRVW